MIIKSEIRVMNNVSRCVNAVAIEGHTESGSISIFFPHKDPISHQQIDVEFELNRHDLQEFLLRTLPSIKTEVIIKPDEH